MSTLTHFSDHATGRVSQRTTLTPEEISYLLDNGVFVNTGKFPVFNREHLLFYSDVDKSCFVAVRDRISGTVVTVLPLEYQSNLAWEISEEDQKTAKELWRKFKASSKTEKRLKRELHTKIGFIHVSMQYIDDEDKIKTRKMFSVPHDEFAGSPEEFYLSEIFTSKVNEFSNSVRIPVKEITAVSIKKGNNGKPFFVPLSSEAFAHT